MTTNGAGPIVPDMTQTNCIHYWILEPAKVNPKGYCRHCGEWRWFNSTNRFVKVLAKRVTLSIEDSPGKIWFYVYPSTSFHQLARLGGPKNQLVLLNGEVLADQENLFQSIHSGDHIVIGLNGSVASSDETAPETAALAFTE